MPLDMDTKPFETRLLLAKQKMEKITTAPNTMVNNMFLPVFLTLPHPVLSRLPLMSPCLHKQTFAFSNIFGPTKPAFIWNTEVLDMMFNAKFSPEWCGLTFAITRYNGFVKIGISASLSFGKKPEPSG